MQVMNYGGSRKLENDWWMTRKRRVIGLAAGHWCCLMELIWFEGDNETEGKREADEWFRQQKPSHEWWKWKAEELRKRKRETEIIDHRPAIMKQPMTMRQEADRGKSGGWLGDWPIDGLMPMNMGRWTGVSGAPVHRKGCCGDAPAICGPGGQRRWRSTVWSMDAGACGGYRLMGRLPGSDPSGCLSIGGAGGITPIWFLIDDEWQRCCLGLHCRQHHEPGRESAPENPPRILQESSKNP